MIRVICDFEHVEQISADHTIEGPEDYVFVRQAIRSFLDCNNGDETLTILVHNTVVASWLEDLRDYGPHTIDWQTTSIRLRFRERFGVSIPPTLSERLIIEHQILEWNETSILPENIEGSILQHICKSDVWLPDEPSSSHFTEFVNWALHEGQVDPLLFPLMQVKLTRWKPSNAHYGVFESSSTLRDKSIQLIARWYLREYPEKFLLDVGLLNSPLIACESDDRMAVLTYYRQQLTDYWSYRFAEFDNAPDAVEEALRVMSGMVDAELQQLIDYLVQTPNVVSIELIRAIQSKFVDLPLLQSEISRLKVLIPLETPPTPAENASSYEMLNWLQDKYLPYFTWVIRNGYSRDDQMQLSNRFAQWLYDAYGTLIYEAQSPLVTSQLHQFEELVSLNRLVLWVIVDGLTWWEGVQLAELASDFHLIVTQIVPQLAALPSITSVSKRAIVRGYLDTHAELGISNAQAAIEELRKRYKTALASTNIKEIQSAARNMNTGVFLWFYNELDTHHHKSDEINDDVVEGHLKRVLRGIQEVVNNCKKRGVRIGIFVSSDHGCTRLPDNARHLELPKFATEWNEDEPKLDVTATRACSIDRDVPSSSLDNLANEWFVLHKDKFSLPVTFIVPQGYNYVGRRPKGWTHGGLSPEEVFVPFIQLQAEATPLQPPRIEIVGNVRSHFASVIKIEVTNPNDIELRNFALSFHWIENRTIDFGTIAARKMTTQEIQLPARTIDGKEISFDYLLSYDVHGQEQLAKGSAKLPVRRLMSSDNINDIF